MDTFVAHKSFLTYYSGYFVGALQGRFSEASSGSIRLPTEEPATFEVFLKWIYTRRIEYEGIAVGLSRGLFTEKLFKLWVLADAHEVPLLQNEVLNLLHLKIADTLLLSTPLLKYLYEHTTPNAPLRRYYIKILATIGSEHDHLGTKSEYWPREALLDVMKHLWVWDRKPSGKLGLWRWDLCEFHVHEEGVQCPK